MPGRTGIWEDVEGNGMDVFSLVWVRGRKVSREPMPVTFNFQLFLRMSSALRSATLCAARGNSTRGVIAVEVTSVQKVHVSLARHTRRRNEGIPKVGD